MNIRRLLAAGSSAIALAACATLAYPGEAELAAGVRTYQSGRFDDAAKYLQHSLDLGLPEADRVTAYKYLAFIHCTSDREALCREEFRKALAIDPKFELNPAEAGHPIWGPAFRSVKDSR